MEFSSREIVGRVYSGFSIVMLYLLLLYIYMVSKKVLSLHKVLFNNNCFLLYLYV